MAAIILSSLQNLKWLKIGYKYIKQPPEVVFGCFYMFTRFPIAKWYLTRDIICVKQGTHLPSVEYFDYKKWSHDTENHCGYLISLVSTDTPSVKTI